MHFRCVILFIFFCFLLSSIQFNEFSVYLVKMLIEYIIYLFILNARQQQQLFQF